MHQDILEAIQRRKKEVKIGGRTLVVCEPAAAADLGLTGEEDTQERYWKILVACVLDEEGKPVFTAEDIPALKDGGRWKLAQLTTAINEVCGFDAEHEQKN